MEFKSKIYNSDPSDYVRIGYLLILKKYRDKFLIFAGSVLLCITCTIVLGLMLISGAIIEEISIILIVLLFSLVVALEFDRRVRNIAALTHSQIDKNEFPFSVLISEDGYRNSGAHDANWIYWNDFKEAIVTQKFILLLKDEDYVIFDSINYTDEQFNFIAENVRKKVKSLL